MIQITYLKAIQLVRATSGFNFNNEMVTFNRHFRCVYCCFYFQISGLDYWLKLVVCLKLIACDVLLAQWLHCEDMLHCCCVPRLGRCDNYLWRCLFNHLKVRGDRAACIRVLGQDRTGWFLFVWGHLGKKIKTKLIQKYNDNNNNM